MRLLISMGKFVVGARPRSAARFYLSIRDNKTCEGIKVELIEAPGVSERWGRFSASGLSSNLRITQQPRPARRAGPTSEWAKRWRVSS